jgi:carbon-monoxide dehydrogenase medium subunit
MIPGAFAYHRPKSVSEAVALLADLGEDARPLGGGHSLVPLMKLRLAAPAHLVDLAGLADLKGIRAEAGAVVIGAMVTQHELIASELIASKVPLLREASLTIADPQVRYVGTVGGNVANGDPGNDLPAVMMALDATYRLVGKGGEREVPARSFYHGAYVTALDPGEILASIRIATPGKHGYAYEKLKRKVGDYATAAAAVVLRLDGGKVASCGIGLTNVGDTPLLAAEASRILTGSTLDPATVKRAARHAAIPHQDGGGDALPRPRPRQGARRLTGR